AAELPARLEQVLAVLYLVFNEGYLASAGEAAERRDLAQDAAWLASLLVRLMPDEPEAIGLLTLMRLHLARADSRFAADGSLVLLPDQDRSTWPAGWLTTTCTTQLGLLLRRLGRVEEARATERRALSLTANPAERRLLEERLAAP